LFTFYNERMTSPLRSFLQFTSLERKRKELARTGTRWQAAMKSDAATAYLEYQKAREETESGDRYEPRLVGASLMAALSPAQVAPYRLEDITEFQGVLSKGSAHYRGSGASPIVPGHEPLDARLIPTALERFVDWLNSPAYGEMHPIEQTTLSQARLYEIWPYETGSALVADLFAVRVLHRTTGIVPWLRPEDLREFYAALSEAFGFATKRLVEFHLRACERACDEVIRRL
jgi:hypothetical protein